MPLKHSISGFKADKKDREIVARALELLNSGDAGIEDVNRPRDKWAHDAEVFEYVEMVRKRMGFRIHGPEEDVLPPGGFSSGRPLWAIAEKDKQ